MSLEPRTRSAQGFMPRGQPCRPAQTTYTPTMDLFVQIPMCFVYMPLSLKEKLPESRDCVSPIT